MYQLMLKLFVKDYQNVSKPEVRTRYGILSGVCGIICNVILFTLKLSIGLFLQSVAVISDAFNNLTDLGTTVVTLAGVKLSSLKPDRDHPFGHGRFEYISALIVSFIIMLVGFELAKSSFEKVLSPTEAAAINWLAIILLTLSLPIKFFMYGYNKKFGKAIDSAPLLAAATDSLNDCIATSAVIVCTIIDSLKLLPFALDGFVGCAVSILIMLSGFSIAKETVNLLLGKAPDQELVCNISNILLESESIIDIHDLIVHDYGPGRVFASVHAEISDTDDIVAAHEAIDKVEKDIFNRLGCEITVHLDPVQQNNEKLAQIKQTLTEFLKDKDASFHDVRMTDGQENINVIFDIAVPFELTEKDVEALKTELKKLLKQIDQRYSAAIQIDRQYCQK